MIAGIIIGLFIVIGLTVYGVIMSSEGNGWGILVAFLGSAFIGAIIAFIVYDKSKTNKTQKEHGYKLEDYGLFTQEKDSIKNEGQLNLENLVFVIKEIVLDIGKNNNIEFLKLQSEIYKIFPDFSPTRYGFAEKSFDKFLLEDLSWKFKGNYSKNNKLYITIKN
ncbi:hypothetical protein [Mesoplasma coleopterae]|uniref:hypothetical protein n=1 Tax=Mesoplasma coleopterae TaxID=324078 RepID=UPI000D04126F|nr:hypothetical protein [Mesoplasma coleopterae]AVN63229.1 hypothetical protein CG000_02950 [Mesoplasma coleopterae]